MAGKYQSRMERRTKQQSPQKKNPKRKAGKIIKTTFLTLFIIGLIGFIAGATTFAIYASDAPPVDEVLLVDPVASEVLDMNGDVFAVLGTEKRDYVEYDQIPKEVEDAVLATEDVRFYKHGGIDFKRLAGAVLANATRGFGSEGASTLTQQIVKLSFLSDEKTLKRKAQEAWLAIKLEQQYTKEQIFEMYVNKIYYANGIHGIETAAKFYFNKELKDLELQERAFLAGLPQRPNGYDPYEHPEAADKRKNIVLSLMYQHDKISKDEMERAKEISIQETLVPEEDNNANPYKHDSFVDQVIREVEKMGDYNVYADGLQIYTTLDPNAQEYTEKMLLTDEVVQFPNDEMQAGIVLMDTQTGEVRAIGGNRYTDIKRGRNFATQLSDRQPGSTIKPIFDYAPAIEYLNWSTYEQVVDEPYSYTGGVPINNFDRNHLGQMSIREALYRSRNIPALKAFQAVGADKVKEFASNIGLDFDELYESASIGGIENISPLQLAGAYGTLGNSGKYNKPYTVKKIILRDGETEVVNKTNPVLAMKDSTAFMVTSMLKDVISTKQGATGQSVIIPGLPAAGKTGTTNYTEDDRKKYGVNVGDVPDAWFAGYTTNYTITVWTGYEKRGIPLRKGTNDQQLAKQLYKNLMQHVSKNIETPDFEMPKSVVKAAVEKGSNPAKKPSKYTPENRIVYEYFVAGTEPKNVSTTFDQLDSPKVKGSYNEESNEVAFEWSHSDSKVKFEVSYKGSNGTEQNIGATDQTSYTIKNVEPGVTYSIQVYAVLDSQKSKAATASVTVPKQEESAAEDEETETDKNNDKNEEKIEDQEDKNNENDKNQDTEKPVPPANNNNQNEEEQEEPTDESSSEDKEKPDAQVSNQGQNRNKGKDKGEGAEQGQKDESAN